MSTPPKSPLRTSKAAVPLWTALPLGLALAFFPQSKVAAQFALDQVHGYAIGGVADYTPSGGGHTGLSGDFAADLGTNGATLLTITDPEFLDAVNGAMANNALSVSIWVKLYEIAAASGFWFSSPSSGSGNRGFQAHLPWSNDNIYFDTAGCCNAGSQRINADIDTFGPYETAGSDAWWNSWHHFVFVKNGNDKQIWIDSQLFLEGTGTEPLPTDINLVDVGSGLVDGVGSLQGQIDDFAVFGSGLSSNNVQSLFTGTTPAALSGVNLLAWWNFNVTKPIFEAIQAGPGATGVSPDISAYYVIVNGATAVQANSIKMAVNGTNVAATILPTAAEQLVEGSKGGATIYYASPTFFPPGSTQTVTLVYSDNASPPNVFSNTWPVVIEAYNGYVVDSQNGHVGFLEGSAVFTLNGGGRTGKAGDYAIDLDGLGTAGDLHVGSASFLNQGAMNNTLSFSMWMKMHHISAGSAVWADSPSSDGGERGFAVSPWSDDNIYFDTAGCCDPTLERIQAPISSLPSYVDDSFWQSWHHYAFVYNAGDKQIWIDGVQLVDGQNTAPLPTDFGDLYFGLDPSDIDYQQTLIDDVAVFASTLSSNNISALASGTLPTALTGVSLLAYWNMDTLSPGPPFISLASTPAPGATNALPDVEADILIVNRNTQVQTNTIKVAFDGKDVTSSVVISSSSAGATVEFVSPTLLPVLSSNWLTVVFSDNASPPVVVSNTWSFVVGPYGRYAEDVVHGYLAWFLGTSQFTPSGGGHTGQAGDFGLNLGSDNASGSYVTEPECLSAVNAAAGLDTLSVSFWLKLSGLLQSSAFWFSSPSVSGGDANVVGGLGRDFQAHLPWGTSDVIYFDTDGCCATPGQRISANIDTFPAYVDDSFWTNWHHFVFLKNSVDKQIYIDGQLFLDGVADLADSASPLATDINMLLIGDGAGSPEGILDDFAIYGEALSSSSIAALYKGASPASVAAASLIAYWSYDNVGPAFVASRSPAPNATGVPVAGPASQVEAVLDDGSTSAVNPASIQLEFNGANVSSQAVVSHPAAGETVVKYAPPLLASGSTNKVTVIFSDNATPPNVVTSSWSYVAAVYTGITKDILHEYIGTLQPGAVFTANGGGHSGKAGDYAIDLGSLGSWVTIPDGSFLNFASSNNVLAMSMWVKKYDIDSGSAWWGLSPSSSGGERGWNVHLPWSDDTVYFDTAGCCDGGLYRINSSITNFPAYQAVGNDGWWTNWHSFVAQYNQGDKQVWIDGALFMEGTNTAALPTDFATVFLGYDYADAVAMHGVVDDYAVYSTALGATDIAALFNGAAPTALTAASSLLAYWPFNDPPQLTKPTISIAIASGKVVITYTGTLQSSATVNGTYSAVTGASSPYTVPTGSGPRMFYRSEQ